MPYASPSWAWLFFFFPHVSRSLAGSRRFFPACSRILCVSAASRWSATVRAPSPPSSAWKGRASKRKRFLGFCFRLRLPASLSCFLIKNVWRYLRAFSRVSVFRNFQGKTLNPKCQLLCSVFFFLRFWLGFASRFLVFFSFFPFFLRFL